MNCRDNQTSQQQQQQHQQKQQQNNYQKTPLTCKGKKASCPRDSEPQEFHLVPGFSPLPPFCLELIVSLVCNTHSLDFAPPTPTALLKSVSVQYFSASQTVLFPSGQFKNWYGRLDQKEGRAEHNRRSCGPRWRKVTCRRHWFQECLGKIHIPSHNHWL